MNTELIDSVTKRTHRIKAFLDAPTYGHGAEGWLRHEHRQLIRELSQLWAIVVTQGHRKRRSREWIAYFSACDCNIQSYLRENGLAREQEARGEPIQPRVFEWATRPKRGV